MWPLARLGGDMTKKDFELIARALREGVPRVHNRPRTDYEQWALTAHDLADALAGTNPQFDRERFLRACGLEEA